MPDALLPSIRPVPRPSRAGGPPARRQPPCRRPRARRHLHDAARLSRTAGLRQSSAEGRARTPACVPLPPPRARRDSRGATCPRKAARRAAGRTGRPACAKTGAGISQGIAIVAPASSAGATRTARGHASRARPAPRSLRRARQRPASRPSAAPDTKRLPYVTPP